jgi:hypothetical protein
MSGVMCQPVWSIARPGRESQRKAGYRAARVGTG